MTSSAQFHDQPAGTSRRRRLAVAICPSDTAYDYELTKLPHDIVLLGNTHLHWDQSLRPLPDNVQVSYGAKDAAADILILGVDQWTFGEIERRALFLRLRDQFRGPTIVVNHGDNLVDGCSADEMRKLVGRDMMVCATDAAKDRWGAERSCVIKRGLTPLEWPQTDYSRGNVVVAQPPHHASFNNTPVIEQLAQRLSNRTVDRLGKNRTFRGFDAYRSFLSTSSIFFNPSHAAPNPGLMVEAQLCGLAVVTTDAHGESAYIKNRQNGFASNDMEKLLDFVDFLQAHPKEVRRIGANGRRTAQAVFNGDRFLAAWDSLLMASVADTPLR